MAKTNRTLSSSDTARHQGHGTPAAVSWPRLATTALFAGAVRHAGSLLAGLVVAWWHHD
ncbi:hypothetical protein PV729_48200 [Streptomyces europaeiscabiei]|uniref:Uncharacterized protein n=1 Tax=Streptomyces europaeiscabiei TaxID=146819 RepID=A0ABU4NX18_9ACTN|nr:hypothetical protein [Streptomyces europaeiscabiei]MDX2774468.1 hypothetical protein [Streptomyces europaeiscabiei]MDX3550117.1 hypothetical protein [Streptomyces europaeiscabiei]MDX3559328.1 hypothetical protein [Streptomyces europaeiscabiei]MDX3707321.1 hypothetical protein [Streptomyces europaeiscabiei]